ncbi:MAG: hypothetical protein U9R20_01835 [Thermodesulfobacteriota bacterium]|nr:hypothetical protein [Thermodesulfobacteriota bacterium]
MVRSLDVQQVLLQSNAVERVQQVQQHQADTQQRHFEAQLAEKKRELRETVKDPEEAQRLMLREEEERDKREKNPGKKGAKKEKDDTDVAGELPVDKSERKIDIRV